MSAPHVVEALAFEVDFATTEQAWQLETLVAAFAQGRALAVIDEVFGQALDDDTVLQLEVLEIDLGCVDGDDLADQWAARLREQLVLQLAGLRRLAGTPAGARAIDTPSASSASWHGATSEALRSPATGAAGVNATPAARDDTLSGGEAASPAPRWRSRAQAELEALLHYLRHGRLPWWQPPRTDLAALARRCAQTQGSALLQGLLASPDAAALRARLVRQFPAPWLCQLEHALQRTAAGLPGADTARLFGSAASPDSAVDAHHWPATWAEAEARLRAVWTLPGRPAHPTSTTALVTTAASDTAVEAGELPAPGTVAVPAGPQAARLRRFKALLVDDAPRLGEDDMAALLALWPALCRDAPTALRALLQTWGVYARVRRRMALLWPEPLLLQLPGLWLPAAEQAQLVGRLQAAHGAPSQTERRALWLRLLRLLLADGGAAQPTAGGLLADLLAAWQGSEPLADAGSAEGWGGARALGHTGGPADGQADDGRSLATTVPPLSSDPAPVHDLRRQLQALMTGPPAAGRAGLRRLGAPWTRQRLLAAMLTPPQLVRCLGWWLPADEAATLAQLAFAPLPAVWQTRPPGAPARGAGDTRGAEQRCQWFLQHIADSDDAAVTASGLVRTWWQGLALQQQRDADALLDDLRAALQAGVGASTPAIEHQRAQAWWRWLATQAPAGADPRAADRPADALHTAPRTLAGDPSPWPGHADGQVAPQAARDDAGGTSAWPVDHHGPHRRAGRNAADTSAALARLAERLQAGDGAGAWQAWWAAEDAAPSAWRHRLRPVLRQPALALTLLRALPPADRLRAWASLARLALQPTDAERFAQGLLALLDDTASTTVALDRQWAALQTLAGVEDALPLTAGSGAALLQRAWLNMGPGLGSRPPAATPGPDGATAPLPPTSGARRQDDGETGRAGGAGPVNDPASGPTIQGDRPPAGAEDPAARRHRDTAARTHGLTIALTRALQAGDWRAVEATWSALAGIDVRALRAWARGAGAQPACRAQLARCPPALWVRWLDLLLPDQPAIAHAAAWLSRGQGPHLQPAWREAVVAWLLAQPAAAPTGDRAAETASLTALLQHLVAAAPSAAWAVIHALASHAAGVHAEAPNAPLRAAAQALVSTQEREGLGNAAGPGAHAGTDGAVGSAGPVGPVGPFGHGGPGAPRDPWVPQADKAVSRHDPGDTSRAPPATGPAGESLDLASALAWAPAVARQAIRLHAATTAGRAALAAAVPGPLGSRLLALFIGEPGAAALQPVLRLLRQALAANAGADDGTADALGQQLVQAMLWTPPPTPGLLAVHLVERAAARLDLSPPLLVRQLLVLAGGRSLPLLSTWAAGRAPVPLGPTPSGMSPHGSAPAGLARSEPSPQAPPAPRPTGQAAGSTRSRAAGHHRSTGEAALAEVVALLRGGATADAWTADQARHLVDRLARGDTRLRAAAARELESPLAAARAAHGLAPDQLLAMLRLLRPGDAPVLQRLWPALQASAAATTPVGATPADRWPAVARVLLRELFEYDRPVAPADLLQRTAQALRRGGARASATPQAAAAALAGPVARATAPLPVSPPLPETDGMGDSSVLPLEGPLFIDNAGLVLLGPYLPRLFSLCGFTDGKRFANPEAAGRAVLLSQYLVSGDTVCPEPLLLLNKLLCGLPLHAAVPHEIALRPAEREAADGLLGAVIAHWSALGKTSPAGLRQTFLQREGRLSHGDEAWQLEVPPQTFDMLLDRLPWGYATLRFPWMPEVLHVQWR